MISGWLKESKREEKGYEKFSVIDLTENPCDILEINSYLAKKIIIHIADPGWLKKRLKKMGEVKFKDFISNHVLPAPRIRFNPQQSFLSEILTAEILEEKRGTMLPIYKLRHKEKQNQAMRGKADVVSCKLDGDKPTIFFVEVKSQTYYKKDVAIKAHDGLVQNKVDVPEIITFFSQKLFKEDKYDLSDIFDDAIDNPKSYSRNYQIFLIFEKDKWSEKILEALESEKIKLPDLTVNVVLINSFKDFVSDTYNFAPDGAVEVCLHE